VILYDLPCLDGLDDSAFPPTSQALDFPSGLLAWGGSLGPTRLIEAYRRGIFPWYSENEPVLWWSPSPRCVLHLREVYVSKRSRRRLRQGAFHLTADTAFAAVIECCAAARESRPSTWISAEMMGAYNTLHEMGVAHSVEAWRDGALVGGIYGLAIGHMFFGESMFSLRSDASKVALIALCRQLDEWGFGPIDCQVSNPHLQRMGAVESERDAFEAALATFSSKPRPDGSWKHLFQPARDW
jgi:leucyl/phenylalanyl-tRNA--protein transferase